MTNRTGPGPDGLKAIYLGHRPAVYFRDKTFDCSIVENCLIKNTEYKFPSFSPKIILDIGANIGVVSVALANLYPEAHIFSFEPIQENYAILLRNVEQYKNVVPFNFGLGIEGPRRIYDSDVAVNFGGFSLFSSAGVNKNSFREIEIRNPNKVLTDLKIVPDLIKIDTEGAEWEILTGLYPHILKQVKFIAGELHGIKDWELLQFLSEDFWLSVDKPFAPRNFHFHALLKNPGLLNCLP